ncbi:hypothetical protein [Thermodesulfobacterium thermophilum]|uniref:hypothetical protein n=1 Tax=Thermodesulfobacterium thermophilum TaxID=886 RepID=UPI0003B3D6D6|nr:hypothetical protein [Thermodesulfobacterium thermophilum]
MGTKQKYSPVYLEDNLLIEFKRRAKGLGLTYSDFLKKLIVSYEEKKTKELKEIVSYFDLLNQKLNELIYLHIKEKVQKQEESKEQKKEPEKTLPTCQGCYLILIALEELAKKLIVLERERADFDAYIKELREKAKAESSYLHVLNALEKLSQKIVVLPEKRKEIAEFIKKLLQEEKHA